MSNRIKELATEAGALVMTLSDGNAYGTLDFNIEKFAQLIVRECAGIAREVGNKTEPDDFALDKCYEIEEMIRQRFRIKE